MAEKRKEAKLKSLRFITVSCKGFVKVKQGFVVNIADFMHILANFFSHNRSPGIVHKGASF